jgi:hypothetical protein
MDITVTPNPVAVDGTADISFCDNGLAHGRTALVDILFTDQSDPLHPVTYTEQRAHMADDAGCVDFAYMPQHGAGEYLINVYRENNDHLLGTGVFLAI